MRLFFAPLQGYTTAIYRRVHHEVVGGIEAYLTPFVRIEHGSRRDLRDICADATCGVPTVVQVIARDRDEFCRLCDAVQQQGHCRIDLNAGCPFPLQTHARRGSGLLPHPDILADIFDEMSLRRDVTFSIKMRLGLADPEEAFRLLPLINEAPLHSVTLHPRLATQQYAGAPDLDTFSLFYQQCHKPLIYNGDIASLQQAEGTLALFPHLHGIMIGRGLLANPTLHLALTDSQRLAKLHLMHQRIAHHIELTMQGEQQQIAHLHAFWQYMEPTLPRKTYKHIMKAGSLRNYYAAVAEAFDLF